MTPERTQKKPRGPAGVLGRQCPTKRKQLWTLAQGSHPGQYCRLASFLLTRRPSNPGPFASKSNASYFISITRGVFHEGTAIAGEPPDDSSARFL